MTKVDNEDKCLINSGVQAVKAIRKPGSSSMKILSCYGQCNSCGWNPDVSKRRLEKIRRCN